MNHFHSTWNSLLEDKTSESKTKELYEELIKYYSSSKRHYHNLDHIGYLIELASKYSHHISDIDTFLFSIFYHDIIYKVTRKDNELKSAELAAERLRSIDYPEEKIKKCFDQIIATASHTTQTDNDTNFLLDFDLGVLGDSKEKYLEYSKNIRKEYAIYPDLLYNPARKKVLEHFLKMPRIYKTKEFVKEREKQARLNVENELLSL